MIEALGVEEPAGSRLGEIRRHLLAGRDALERMDRNDEIPAALLEWMWESGLMTLALSDNDGVPASTTSLCDAIEELGHHSGALALLALAQATGTTAVLLGADDEQRKRYLASIRERHFIAFALSETRAGSDARNMETRIFDRGDHLEVIGAKWLVTNAWGADHFVVFGQHIRSGHALGISAVVLDRGMPGLLVAAKNDLFGMRGVPTASVVMKQVRVPRSRLLGREGDGFSLAMRTLDRSRPLVGAQAVGLARAALEQAVQHCRRRRAFGGPLAGLDGVRLMIADMAIAVEASRLLVRRAAEVVDTGRQEATALAASAKLHATDAAVRVALDAIQLLGGYGCFRGRAPERILRDAKLAQIYEGPNQILRLVVGRHVLDPLHADSSADDGSGDPASAMGDGHLPSMDGGNDP